jgi:pSer/pThr/pTyr-binding forkhead associated (FHA) protein
MPYILLCRTGDDAGLACRIEGGTCLIGRAADCNLSLLHGQLSRHHARVAQAEDGGLAIEDLGSKNGTSVNGEPARKGAPLALAHCDLVTIGTELQFVLLDLDRVPQGQVVAASLVGPDETRVPLQLGPNVIGSDHGCDLIVEDPSVKPRHARIVVTSSGVAVEPDADAGPVLVNGTQVESMVLRHADILTLSPSAEFGIEVVTGLLPEPTVAPGVTQLHAEADASAGTIEVDTAKTGQAEAQPPAAKPPVPASVTGEAWDRAAAAVIRPAAPAVRVDSTASIPLADVAESLRKARQRRIKERDESTDSGVLPGASADEPAGLRRTWSSKAVAGTPQKLQPARREAAARIHVLYPRPDGATEERVTLLREGRHLVGRADDCRVVIGDLSVSRHHAEVDVGPQAIMVRDLGSSNGTWYQDRRLEQAAVKSGSRLRFGDVEAWFDEL